MVQFGPKHGPATVVLKGGHKFPDNWNLKLKNMVIDAFEKSSDFNFRFFILDGWISQLLVWKFHGSFTTKNYQY